MGLILKPRVGLLPRWSNNPMAIPPPSHAFVLNEEPSLVLHDLITGGLTGTITGAPVWVGQNLYIDAASHILVDDSMYAGQTYSAMSVFVLANYAADPDNFGHLVGSHDGWFLRYRTTPDAITFLWANGDIVTIIATPSSNMSAKPLYSIGGAVGNGSSRGYFEGNFVGEDASLANASITLVAGHTCIGGYYDGSYDWKGNIGLVYIWYGTKLSDAQMAYLHQHPYYFAEYPELWELYAAAAAEGPVEKSVAGSMALAGALSKQALFKRAASGAI